MGGSTALKVRFDSRLAGWVAVVAGLVLASPAPAFEALDGRIQVHGFAEMQIRSIARDYELQDGWDLTQWYNVLNIEADFDIAPDGWGPFNLISAFTRIEARYDCVWTRGCGMFPSVNTFGDRARRLPRRMNDGFRDAFNAQQPDRDRRSYSGIDSQQLDYSFAFGDPNRFGNPVGNENVGNRDRLVRVFQLPGLEALFGNSGADSILDPFDLSTNDDPALVTFAPILDYEFGVRSVPGSQGGVGAQILGPLLPKNRIEPTGRLRTSPNPFRGQFGGGVIGTGPGLASGLLYPITPATRVDGGDLNPHLPTPAEIEVNGMLVVTNGGSEDTDVLGNALFLSFENFQDQVSDNQQSPLLMPNGRPPSGVPLEGTDLPFRPAPLLPNGVGPKHLAQGLFYPNARQAEFLRDDEFSSFDQNFRQEELAWNRGSSQQEEKELKEFYFDIEAFDARLWARLGKQSIVWGKTELFRTTDQFNPQDVALATLPSLEESRIALWAARFVWSFYDIGPLQDVRLEAAFNFDQFEPADLGRCGEPYTVFSACAVTTGLWGNGVTNAALAGVVKPPDPWNSLKGLEVGARAEFRWSRFSFAITDFYGYGDFPVVERLFTYSRNVDPATGRPRHTDARGPCTTGTEPACLRPGTTGPNNALTHHSANQQFFAVICSSSIGFSTLDPSVCAQSVLNSKQKVTAASIFVGAAIGNLATGSFPGQGVLFGLMDETVIAPRRVLNPAPPPNVIEKLPAARLRDALEAAGADLNGDGAFSEQSDLPLVRVFNDASICNRVLDPTPDPVISSLPGFPQLLAECVANPDPDGPDSIAEGFIADMVNNPVIADGLHGKLTDQQEALLGCGPFYNTRCDVDGIDLLNAEASFVLQAWPSIEGTFQGGEVIWDVTDVTRAQPGTVGFAGGPSCTRFVDGQLVILPGCNPQLTNPTDNSVDNLDWNRLIDGTSPSSDEAEATVQVELNDPAADTINSITRHPFACAFSPFDPAFVQGGGETYVQAQARRGCQLWASEGAAVSWNALMGFAALSAPDRLLGSEVPDSFPLVTMPGIVGPIVPGSDPRNCRFNFSVNVPTSTVTLQDLAAAECFKPAAIDELDILQLFRTDGCSLIRPQLCSNVRAVMGVTAVKRPTRRAAGNGRFGRRDFLWHDGSQAYIRYEKRNVFGFSMDFAEDITKSNWSMEATWIEGLPETDNDEFDGLTETDQYNLTISVDRPTFINFLNPNRTFFINSQWFFQYVKGYEKGFPGRGPWNFLFTFSVFTGYFQDRLNPAMTYVYDVRSNSGAILPEIEYRFSDKFSATVGFAFFFGRYDRRTFPINSIGGSGNHVGKGAYRSFVERGLSVVQDRDEAFLLLRYTF